VCKNYNVTRYEDIGLSREQYKFICQKISSFGEDLLENYIANKTDLLIRRSFNDHEKELCYRGIICSEMYHGDFDPVYKQLDLFYKTLRKMAPSIPVSPPAKTGNIYEYYKTIPIEGIVVLWWQVDL
jgi:hypothetical protein